MFYNYKILQEQFHEPFKDSSDGIFLNYHHMIEALSLPDEYNAITKQEALFMILFQLQSNGFHFIFIALCTREWDRTEWQDHVAGELQSIVSLGCREVGVGVAEGWAGRR